MYALRCLLAGASLLIAASAIAQAPNVVDVGQVGGIVAKTVNSWAGRQQIYVAPGFVDDLTAGLQGAVRAGCWGTASHCRQANDASVIAASLMSYLDDLSANPAATFLPGDRLLTRIGFAKRDLGWPSAPAANRYLLVDLPGQASDVAYIGWNGARPMPGSVRRVLVVHGVHGFVSRRQSDADRTALRLIARRDASGTITSQWTEEGTGRQAPTSPWRIDPELSRFCLDKPVDPTEPKYRLSTGRDAPPVADPSEFRSAEVLRVVLEGDGSTCDAQCKEWVASSIIQSLAQWRAGCSRCQSSTLSVVVIGNSTYVAVRFLETALQLPYLRTGLEAGDVLSPDDAAMASTKGAGVNVRMGFQRVDGLASRLNLCSSGAPGRSINGFPVLSARAREQLCQPAIQQSCSGSSACKEVVVRLSGASDCANALACGFPDRSVTLNTPRFRFTLLGPDSASKPATQLGSASATQGSDVVPLHPVILHEVGHWFGLPHVDPDPDAGRDEVMVDVGGDDKACISKAALNMLDSAIDRAWTFRHTGIGKLRYAPR